MRHNLVSGYEFAKEPNEIAAEAIGWMPLGDGTYFHVVEGIDHDEEEVVITVMDVLDTSMVWGNVLFCN